MHRHQVKKKKDAIKYVWKAKLPPSFPGEGLCEWVPCNRCNGEPPSVSSVVCHTNGTVHVHLEKGHSTENVIWTPSVDENALSRPGNARNTKKKRQGREASWYDQAGPSVDPSRRRRSMPVNDLYYAHDHSAIRAPLGAVLNISPDVLFDASITMDTDLDDLLRTYLCDQQQPLPSFSQPAPPPAPPPVPPPQRERIFISLFGLTQLYASRELPDTDDVRRVMQAAESLVHVVDPIANVLAHMDMREEDIIDLECYASSGCINIQWLLTIIEKYTGYVVVL